jgi:hypothetical protein
VNGSVPPRAREWKDPSVVRPWTPAARASAASTAAITLT